MHDVTEPLSLPEWLNVAQTLANPHAAFQAMANERMQRERMVLLAGITSHVSIRIHELLAHQPVGRQFHHHMEVEQVTEGNFVNLPGILALWERTLHEPWVQTTDMQDLVRKKTH